MDQYPPSPSAVADELRAASLGNQTAGLKQPGMFEDAICTSHSRVETAQNLKHRLEGVVTKLIGPLPDRPREAVTGAGGDSYLGQLIIANDLMGYTLQDIDELVTRLEEQL